MKRTNGIISTSSKLLGNRLNAGAMRPYFNSADEPCMVVYKGKGDRKDPASYEEVLIDNATLRYDEWKTLDDAVIKVAEQRLVGYDDLRRNGLVYNLNNAMGTTVLIWEEMSDAMSAVVSIDPVKRGDNDAVDFSTTSIPIPIIHADYQISERILQESRNRGNALSTIYAERAARKVAEKLEDMLFGATATMVYGGGTIHSYFSFPDVTNIPWTSAGIHWDAAGKTAAQIVADVVTMKTASITDKHYGPWMLYVPQAYESLLDEDYSVSGSSIMTIRQRIMLIGGIQGVKVVDRAPADSIALVQMSNDTVDLVDGMPIQNVEWSTEGGFVHNYKVMTIQVPRIKSDYNGTSGIVTMTP